MWSAKQDFATDIAALKEQLCRGACDARHAGQGGQ
jgi:hypothetical protein